MSFKQITDLILINEEYNTFAIKLNRTNCNIEALIIGELTEDRYRFRLITDSTHYLELTKFELQPLIKILNKAYGEMKDE